MINSQKKKKKNLMDNIPRETGRVEGQRDQQTISWLCRNRAVEERQSRGHRASGEASLEFHQW